MLKHPIIGVGTFQPSPRAKELVSQVLESLRLSYGPLTQKFESSFSKLHGCRFGIMSNSGTSSLHVAVSALKEIHGWHDGDEILVPATTFIATPNVILHNNLKPVFVEVDPIHYCMDPNSIEKKISPRTRALIPVHPFGQSSDMNPICQIATTANLKIIEDSCETMFAKYKGQSVGSMGDIACFSTYIAHLIVTGVGGLSTTNNPEYAIKMRSLVNHGRDSIYLNIDDDDDLTKEELQVIIGRRFSFVSVGHSFRITEMEAALGLAQLEEWESLIAKRRANARKLMRELSNYNDRLQLPTIREECEHSFMMFPIVLRDQPKTELTQYLEEHGVETREMLPLINQPIYKKLFDFPISAFPVSQWIIENGFYIGCHQDLSDSDLDYIIELFTRYWKPRSLATQQETSLLALLINDDDSNIEETLEILPFELFDEIIVFTHSPNEWLKNQLQGHPVKVEYIGKEDPLIFLARQELPFDNIVLYPANGSYDPRNIAKLLFALESGNEMATASRFIPGGLRHDRMKRFSYRSLGNRIFTMLANILFYGNLTDTLCRFRAIKTKCLQNITLEYKDLTFLYFLSIQAIRQGWNVREIPTQEAIDISPTQLRKTWRSVWPMLSLLIRTWFKRGENRPNKGTKIESE